jgi:hypothetical protein
MPFQHLTTLFYIKIHCAVTSGSEGLVEGNVCSCVLGEELFPARKEVRGTLLLEFFLFVGGKEKEDERKSGTQTYQKVVSQRHQSLLLRPRLSKERKRLSVIKVLYAGQ